MTNIKAYIIGAAGYGGGEIIRILAQHPNVDIIGLGGHSNAGRNILSLYPHLKGYCDLELEKMDLDKIGKIADVVFVALPHGHSVKVCEAMVQSGTKTIDLGADFRFDDVETYEKWYEVEHANPQLNKKAVYGVPEIWRDDIKGADIIANPGCYPTGAILALYPLIKEKLIDVNSVIIDAKSGVSGAGRTPGDVNVYSQCNESIKAYKIASHRHIPEIEQSMFRVGAEKCKISFTPHLTPMTRGILTTAYAALKDDAKNIDLQKLYEDTYADEFFVRVCEKGVSPASKDVAGSNFCDIGITVDKRTNRIIVCSAIDNLVKGAAGQAVQNMNLIFDLPEDTALKFAPVFP